MKLFSLIMLALLPGAMYAGTLKMTLSEALKDNSVKLEAVNFKGGYLGKTTRLSVTNNTKSMIQITVDIGVILKPEDIRYQPMVLAGEEMMVLMPKTSGAMEVQTFCGNSPELCPSTNLHYFFSRVAGDTLVKILRFIKTNDLFDGLGQGAVWAITNNHAVRDVYDPERDEVSKKLIDLICAVTGRPKPDYYTFSRSRQEPNEPAYVPKTLKIFAEFELRLDASKTLTLGIFDSLGNMAQPVFENKEFGATGHRFNVEFEAENVPAGKYYIRLKEGDGILQEKMVKVE